MKRWMWTVATLIVVIGGIVWLTFVFAFNAFWLVTVFGAVVLWLVRLPSRERPVARDVEGSIQGLNAWGLLSTVDNLPSLP